MPPPRHAPAPPAHRWAALTAARLAASFAGATCPRCARRKRPRTALCALCLDGAPADARAALVGAPVDGEAYARTMGRVLGVPIAWTFLPTPGTLDRAAGLLDAVALRVLTAHLVGGKPQREIAAGEGRSQGWVSAVLDRARRTLEAAGVALPRVNRRGAAEPGRRKRHRRGTAARTPKRPQPSRKAPKAPRPIKNGRQPRAGRNRSHGDAFWGPREGRRSGSRNETRQNRREGP